MTSLRLSYLRVVTLLVTLAAYLAVTTVAAAHLHTHEGEEGSHGVEIAATAEHQLHGDCALCDHGPFLALPGCAEPVALPAALLLDRGITLPESPRSSRWTVTTLRGPPAL